MIRFVSDALTLPMAFPLPARRTTEDIELTEGRQQAPFTTRREPRGPFRVNRVDPGMSATCPVSE
jgi:hypothetical protein